MPTTVPNRPTKGAVEPMVARPAEAALQLGVNDGFGALEGAAGSFELFARQFGGITVGLELLQTGGDNLCQMALLVAVGNLDGFLDLAVLQGSGDGRGKGTRLAAGSREGEGAINHDTDRPAGHEEQDNDNDLGQEAHLLPQRDRIPSDAAFGLLEEQDRGLVHVAQNQSCNVCENHELIFLLRTL